MPRGNKHISWVSYTVQTVLLRILVPTESRQKSISFVPNYSRYNLYVRETYSDKFSIGYKLIL